MASKTSGLEAKLDELFVQNAPVLPTGVKKALTAWMPLASAVAGVLALLTAWYLWHWARSLGHLLNRVCNAYSVSGCGNPPSSRFSVWLWLGVALLAAEGVLYLLAYRGLRDHKKEGWNYAYYGVVLHLIYTVATLFIGYKTLGNFLGGLIGCGVGFYVLFQTRALYAPTKQPVAATKVAKAGSKRTAKLSPRP